MELLQHLKPPVKPKTTTQHKLRNYSGKQELPLRPSLREYDLDPTLRKRVRFKEHPLYYPHSVLTYKKVRFLLPPRQPLADEAKHRIRIQGPPAPPCLKWKNEYHRTALLLEKQIQTRNRTTTNPIIKNLTPKNPRKKPL